MPCEYSVNRIAVIQALLTKISDNITESDSLLCVLSMPKYTTVLPATTNTSGQKLATLLIDREMQLELEKTKVINWCRTVTDLYAISTCGRYLIKKFNKRHFNLTVDIH